MTKYVHDSTENEIGMKWGKISFAKHKTNWRNNNYQGTTLSPPHFLLNIKNRFPNVNRSHDIPSPLAHLLQSGGDTCTSVSYVGRKENIFINTLAQAL